MDPKNDLKAFQDALTVIGSYAMQTDRRHRNKNIRRVVGDYMIQFGCLQSIVTEKPKPKRFTWLRFLGKKV